MILTKKNAKIPLKKHIYAAERRSTITKKTESLKLPPCSKMTHRQAIFPLFRINTNDYNQIYSSGSLESNLEKVDEMTDTPTFEISPATVSPVN